MAVRANPDLSDEVLMTLYQAGEYEAFEILYRRHSGRVFEFLRKKSDPQTAGELLQETFLKIHRSRARYSSQYPFLPWLFTVARNVHLDSLRRAENKITSRSTSDEGVDFGAASAMPAAVGLDMALALESLPENQRRAIELRYLSDWSFEQIAAEMKTSPLNARQLISRGVKRLRSTFMKADE